MPDIQSRADAFVQEQIDRGEHVGVQVSAFLHGEPIVELAMGKVGPKDDRPVRPDTLFSSFSTTKGVTATLLNQFVDRGEVELDSPVANYWPEFAQAGKEAITVEQVLVHQAGLHPMPRPLTREFFCDWDACLDWVARMEPVFEPGTAAAYHAHTFGYLVGGILRGVTGRHVRDLVVEEIARPLGVEGEMYIGLPDDVPDDRLATLAAPKSASGNASTGGDENPLAKLPDDHDHFQAMPPEQNFTFNDRDIRRACAPGSNGHFTARSLARMYAALGAGGEIDGCRILSARRAGELTQPLARVWDRVLFYKPSRGAGYFMGGRVRGVTPVSGPRPTSFGHSGYGGSTAFADPEVGYAAAITVNRLHVGLAGEGPTADLCAFLRREFGID